MFTICSWNLFMKKYNYRWRIVEICEKISSKNPDVICLQEVTPDFMTLIKRMLPDYTINLYEVCGKEYGKVILSKLPVISKGFEKLNSEQGCINLWIEVFIDNKLIRINTSQLESTKDFSPCILKKTKDIRQEQLLFIKESNINKNWLWIGDSNLLEDEEHEMFNSSISTYFNKRFIKENIDEMNQCYDKIWVNNVHIRDFCTISAYDGDGYYLSTHDGIIASCVV